MPSTRNIIVGAAALYISEADSLTGTQDANGWVPPALPRGTAGASLTGTLDDSADWRNVGYTTDGITLSYEPTYSDVEVDQLLDSAKVFKTAMRVTVATSLVEASLENLLVAWGQSGTPTTSTNEDEIGISAGALGDDPVERAMIAVGPAPRSATGQKRERVYYTRRVLSVDTTAVASRRAEATVFPVSFRVLPMTPNGTTVTVGQEYGVVRDRRSA